MSGVIVSPIVNSTTSKSAAKSLSVSVNSKSSFSCNDSNTLNSDSKLLLWILVPLVKTIL